jgi:hypothetical protein
MERTTQAGALSTAGMQKIDTKAKKEHPRLLTQF